MSEEKKELKKEINKEECCKGTTSRPATVIFASDAAGG